MNPQWTQCFLKVELTKKGLHQCKFLKSDTKVWKHHAKSGCQTTGWRKGSMNQRHESAENQQLNSAGPLSGVWPCVLLLLWCWCFCGVLMVLCWCSNCIVLTSIDTSAFYRLKLCVCVPLPRLGACTYEILSLHQVEYYTQQCYMVWKEYRCILCQYCYVFILFAEAQLHWDNTTLSSIQADMYSAATGPQGMLQAWEDNIIHNLETKNGRTSHIKSFSFYLKLVLPICKWILHHITISCGKGKHGFQKNITLSHTFHATLFPLRWPLHLRKRIIDLRNTTVASGIFKCIV